MYDLVILSIGNTMSNNSIGNSIKHDPNGLVQRDIRHLRQVYKPKPYSPKMTHAEIMYLEGQQSVINYIERDMVAK